MFVWLKKPLRTHLFISAPVAAEVWIGSVTAIDVGREIVPLRFAGLDFWIMFVSPHTECDHDDTFMRQMFALVDENDLEPAGQSRLIKFCRASAEAHHFMPNGWPLPRPQQIFQFTQTLGHVMELYCATVPEIEQFFYLPASQGLERLYDRVFRRLSKKLGKTIIVRTRPNGALHVIERTRIA